MNTQEIIPPSNKLWVSNLHANVTREELENTFGCFGEVTRVYIDARRFAFVVFNAVEPAKTALQNLQNQALHGHRMFIQFAKPAAGQHRIESHSNTPPPPPPPHQQRPDHYLNNPVLPHPAAGSGQHLPPHAAVVGTSNPFAHPPGFSHPNTTTGPVGPSVLPLTQHLHQITGSVRTGGPAWTGVIAKGGVPICQARCDPILLPWINAANIPPVLNLSEKTALESLQSYFSNSGAIGYSIAIFSPEPEANLSPYTELLAYFTQKGVAGVARLNDGSSLYLVPYPSAFLSDGLMFSGRSERRLYGVVIKFPPSETPRRPSGSRVSRDPRRRPENMIRRPNKNPPSSSIVGVQIAASMPQPSSSGSGPSVEVDHRRRDCSAAGEQMMAAAGPVEQPDNDVLKRPATLYARDDEVYDPEDWEPLAVESSSDLGMDDENDKNDYVLGTSRYPPRKRLKRNL